MTALGIAAQAAAPEPQWQVAPDGASVISPVAKLAWDRCVNGQRWNGRACEGEVVPLSIGEATALAGDRSRSSGKTCRLPTMLELKTLAAQVVAKRKKTGLFPSIATGWRWSGTRIVDTSEVNQYDYGNVMRNRNNENAVRVDVLHGWAMDIATGEARRDVTKRSRLPIQLVCAP